ncbi:hypothetical protein K492DRAFT_174236 [Lichtheimia hyalospora FSU 10163]|nr:hypothetical protein K492DRAFT_174236 [Lichtheimia hyalospora FSU 10163]
MSTVTSNIWFEGPVSEAVALVNSKDCVFVVYIFDDTENTQKLNETLDNEQVIHALSSKAVALKMHTESDNAKMFKQLYPTYHVPVIYFIRHGTIKDFGVEDITADAIISKINATSNEQPSQQQTSPTTPAPPAPTPSSTETSTVADQPQSSQGNSSIDATDAAKKEKLRKQMEQAKKKREEEEKQRAKDNELKRRQDGKLMQQTKQQLENKQNKQYFDKIKKEKREDEEHRKRIKEQIARDRAEQMASRQAAKQQRKLASSSSSETSVKRASSQHDHSSISIRQLDGSTMRNRFNASDTLSVVKTWIDQNRSDGDQPYKLLAQFPTRQFSIGDEERSLRELDLCPSATLIMKGIKNVSNAYGAGTSYGMMDYVYSAGGLLYNAASSVGTTVSGVMYSMFPSDQSAPADASPGSFPNSSNVTQQASSSIPGQRLGGAPSSARTRSNINTLHNTAFDDDDNEHRTYNGNSVNQE